MKSGVSFPSYASLATLAVVTGTLNASYPLSNLSNLKNIRKVAKTSTTGVLAFTFVLPAAVSIQFLALVHHNAAGAETVRIRLFSDNNPDPVGNAGAIVHDSTAVAMFPSGAAASSDYPQNRPYRLSAAVTARSGRIDLSSHASNWQIGGLEIGGWWEFQDVQVPRSLGLQSNDAVVDQGGNIEDVTQMWSPRRVGIQRLVLQSENETTMMDFQLEKKTSNPFMWVWDMDDPSTWPREAMLVTNYTLPGAPSGDHPSGRQSFDFIEHLG